MGKPRRSFIATLKDYGESKFLCFSSGLSSKKISVEGGNMICVGAVLLSRHVARNCAILRIVLAQGFNMAYLFNLLAPELFFFILAHPLYVSLSPLCLYKL